MPKTSRKFDWEIFNEKGEFIDMLSFTRNEAKEYHKQFPKYTMQEVCYSENGKYATW